MGTFKSQPDHYDVIKNIEDPIVTWDSLTNYEGSIRTRLDLKTDKTETEALTSRVAKDEGDIDNLEKTKEDKTVVNALTSRVSNVESTKADKTELAKTNRNLEEVNNKASHNATDIANLHDDIEGVRGQYTTLSNSFSTLQTKYGELNAYSGKVDVLQGDISDLWDQVNAGGIGGGGSGGGGGVEPSEGDYYTKTESNSRFALKTSLNSYLTKSEAERIYAQEADIDALKKQIEELEEQLKPIGSIHVNISSSKKADFSSGKIAIRNTNDTEPREDGSYKSQQEKALVNGEVTFTNIKQGDWKTHVWRVGYKKAWDASPEHFKNLSSSASFSMTADTREFTSLPYAYVEVTNNTGIDFDYYTYSTSKGHPPKSGKGYIDNDTGEHVNYTWKNGRKLSFTISETARFERNIYVYGVNNTDQNKYYQSEAIMLDMGTYKSLTATKGELQDYSAGDQGLPGPEIMASGQSDVAAMQEQLDNLRAQLNGLLEAQKQVEPTGGEGPGI